ncbi:hypothetical protein DDB_G0276117 [Dictyostelium discoideum AX4]|uniref:N-acetyltransferase domain-containing protein n=1 Tax=Dictyostelium discoideum TaxID=44689 RepID=Q75JG5_DICDI|nr:hypothetical protein DDB_G0276117 [Dictyostelium discoideum AX4]EAL69358.1 hypothetical protein DDB_G0276117 [Dictyostelium discoideum AX4]|eukprot:XP_643256.1 hypothetical protein DDB_G0276117 [Dictyostelium discoideum AX4]
MISFSYIHNDNKYIEELIKLLNSQWPRSEYSRKASIEKSNDNFPFYLIMKLKNDELTVEETEEVIGCLTISTVLNNDKDSNVSLLLENVLIKSKYRGKGYGKLLMIEGHKIMKKKGYKISYLSTNDKQEFYKTFGYIECDPISTSNFSSCISSNSSGSSSISKEKNEDNIDDSEKVSNLLRIFGGNSKLKKTNTNLVWMKLNLE